jgi:tetratricopeptide (TPR) repeat protein
VSTRAFILVLLILTAAAFVPVFRSAYIQDDHLAVEENVIVARGDLGEIFRTDYWAGASGADGSLYRPVTILSYAMERTANGPPSARISHAVNLALHFLVCLTLAALALKIGFSRPVSYTAAWLFALHPLHTEAVAGVVGRAELLTALFALGAMLFWHWTWEDETSPGTARLASWGCGLLVFAALGSKEIGVAILPLLVLLDLYRFGPGAGRPAWRDLLLRRAAAFAPVLLATLCYTILRISTLQALLVPPSPHALDNPLVAMNAGTGLFTALGLLTRYVFLLIAPLRLSADYSGPIIAPEPSLLGILPLVGVLLLALLAGGAMLPFLAGKFKANGRLFALQIGCSCALFLLPYLVIGNLFVHVGTIFAERLVYLPSAGFCLLAGMFLVWLSNQVSTLQGFWKRLPPVLAGGMILWLILGSYGLGTYARSSDWLNDESLFNAVLRVYPDSPRANFIVAKIEGDRVFDSMKGRPRDLVLSELGRPQSLLNHAVKVQPDYSVAWNELGLIEARLGHYPEAIRLFEKTIALAPRFPRAHLNLAIAASSAGRKGAALKAAKKAVRLTPRAHKPWAQLGHLQFETGNRAGALRAYTQAVALGRDDLLPRLESLRAHVTGQQP